MAESKASLGFSSNRTSDVKGKDVGVDRPCRTIAATAEWEVPYPPSYIGTPLYKAVLLADKQLVQNLLKSGSISSVGNRCGWSVVCTAVLGGNEEILDLLLRHGASPLAAGAAQLTPIHYAAHKGAEGCLKLLVQSCESRRLVVSKALLQGDKLGVTALHSAAANANTKCLSFMLRHLQKGMLDPQDHKKRTPVHWAASHGNEQAVSLLVRDGANLLIADCSGRTPLHWAVLQISPPTPAPGSTGVLKASLTVPGSSKEMGGSSSSGGGVVEATEAARVNCINKILTEAPKIIGWQDHEGVTALHLAADRCCVPAVQALLEHTATPALHCNTMDNRYRTPLHWAAMRGATAIARLLLRAGSDLDAVDETGATPLHYAAHYNHSDCVLLLSQQPNVGDGASSDPQSTAVVWAAAAKADQAIAIMVRHGTTLVTTNKRGGSWCPALHVAAGCGHLSTVELLLDLCRLPDSEDDAGTTPLHLAAYGGSVHCVKHLIKRGASLSRRNRVGWHTLHYATAAGHLYVAQLLLRAGTDVNVHDYYGRSCLHVSALKGYLGLVSLFVENKAAVDARDNQGGSALHCAAEAGDVAVINTLLEAGAYHSCLKQHSVTAVDVAVARKHEAAATALRLAGALTAREVQTIAATAIQRAWKKHHRSHTRRPGLASSTSTVDSSRPAHSANVSSPEVVSITDTKLKPVSLRASDVRVRPTRIVVKNKPSRHSLPLSREGGGTVGSALLRAARAHSSCRELNLPPPHTLGIKQDRARSAPLAGSTLQPNRELMALLHSPLYGLASAVQQPTNIAVALVSQRPFLTNTTTNDVRPDQQQPLEHNSGENDPVQTDDETCDRTSERRTEIKPAVTHKNDIDPNEGSSGTLPVSNKQGNYRQQQERNDVQKVVTQVMASHHFSKHSYSITDHSESSLAPPNNKLNDTNAEQPTISYPPPSTVRSVQSDNVASVVRKPSANSNNNNSSSSSSNVRHVGGGPEPPTVNTGFVPQRNSMSLAEHLQRGRVRPQPTSPGRQLDRSPHRNQDGTRVKTFDRQQKIDDFKKKKNALRQREVKRASTEGSFSYNLHPPRAGGGMTGSASKSSNQQWRT